MDPYPYRAHDQEAVVSDSRNAGQQGASAVLGWRSAQRHQPAMITCACSLSQWGSVEPRVKKDPARQRGQRGQRGHGGADEHDKGGAAGLDKGGAAGLGPQPCVVFGCLSCRAALLYFCLGLFFSSPVFQQLLHRCALACAPDDALVGEHTLLTALRSRLGLG